MKKISRRDFLVASGVAAAAGALTACGASGASSAASVSAAASTAASASAGASSAAAPATLTFWSWLPTTVQWDEMSKAFQEQYPEITLNYTRTEQDDFMEKLQVAMASGTGPDLFGLSTGTMAQQYASFVEPMDTLADQYMPDWRDVISETAVSQCVVDDVTVGMPLLVAGMTDLLYNKTILDECGVTDIPRTYADLKTAADKIKAKGYIPVAVGAADDWISADIFVQVSNEFEQGAVYDAEAGKRKWTDQCFVDTLAAWKQMFTDGIFEDGALGVCTYPDARDQYFFARKAAFFLTGSWHLGPTSPSNTEIENTEIKNKNDVIGMCILPSLSPDGKICGTAGVDTLIAVNKDCKAKDAAMKFVEFMANGKGQQLYVNYLQGAPVSNQIKYSGDADGELQQQSIDEVNSYVSGAVGNRKLQNSELETAIVVAMQNVAAGGDPAAELQTVQATADSL